MRKSWLFVVSVLSVLALSGCGGAAGAASPAWKITIVGAGKEASFSSVDLQKTGTVKLKAALKEKEAFGPEDEWTGVPLARVLEHAGFDAHATVKVESADGSGREYTPDLVSSDGTILGMEVNGKALDRESGPVQLVVSGKGPNWWLKRVAKITVIK